MKINNNIEDSKENTISDLKIPKNISPKEITSSLDDWIKDIIPEIDSLLWEYKVKIQWNTEIIKNKDTMKNILKQLIISPNKQKIIQKIKTLYPEYSISSSDLQYNENTKKRHIKINFLNTVLWENKYIISEISFDENNLNQIIDIQE